MFEKFRGDWYLSTETNTCLETIFFVSDKLLAQTTLSEQNNNSQDDVQPHRCYNTDRAISLTIRYHASSSSTRRCVSLLPYRSPSAHASSRAVLPYRRRLPLVILGHNHGSRSACPLLMVLRDHRIIIQHQQWGCMHRHVLPWSFHGHFLSQGKGCTNY